MNQDWTFGRRLAVGFGALIVMTIVIGAVAVYSLRAVITAKDQVITVGSPRLIAAEGMRTAREASGAAARAFLLTKDARFLDELADERSQFLRRVEELKQYDPDGELRRQLGDIERAYTDHARAIDDVIAMSKSGAPQDEVLQAYDDRVGPPRQRLEDGIQTMYSEQSQSLDDHRQASTDSAVRSMYLMVTILGLAIVVAIIVALMLIRTLSTRIGSAVGQIQSSSMELQSAANQQAVGAKEQATAMNEVSTTITELLATSRQIAESAQRVAEIAEETAASAGSGGVMLEGAEASISGIRRQVELVVAHMLDLGKKSQQIGSVLDIVSELAEQTNILAINATIEAAGAGESGKRFAIVADEIRKLADRVAGSTKEIRGLIEDIRSAVNTTVMATETGFKTVEAGSKQFADVAAGFTRIRGLVSTTSEAAREIELSTKQQATAVEQVNMAIAGAAQATKETEASSSQTLQTASQLAGLSKGLMQLVRREAA